MGPPSTWSDPRLPTWRAWALARFASGALACPGRSSVGLLWMRRIEAGVGNLRHLQVAEPAGHTGSRSDRCDHRSSRRGEPVARAQRRELGPARFAPDNPLRAAEWLPRKGHRDRGGETPLPEDAGSDALQASPPGRWGGCPGKGPRHVISHLLGRHPRRCPVPTLRPFAPGRLTPGPRWPGAARGLGHTFLACVLGG